MSIAMKIRQSHARTYRKCKRKYKLQVIDKLVTKDRKIALSIGTACHAGRAKWLATKNKLEALEAANASLRREAVEFPDAITPEQRTEAFATVSEVVITYCDQYESRFPGDAIKVLSIEVPFEVKIAEHEDLELFVVGTQDADVIFANKYRMNFEYKTTSKQLPTFFEQEALSLQHRTYCLAQSIITGEVPYGTLLDVSRKPLKTQGPVHDHLIIALEEDELIECRRDYVEMLKEIAYSTDNDYFPPNDDSCFSIYGKCEYFPICKSKFDPHIIRNNYAVIDDTKALMIQEDE